jgi:hypothetical protein
MTIAWRKPKNVATMTIRNVDKIAKELSANIIESFALTREDPFLYLQLLADTHNIKAKAFPVIKNRKLLGYNFKTAS